MPKKSVSDWIDTFGFGPAQLYVEVLAHGVWIANGMELTMVTVLAGSIQKDLQLSSMQIASLASIVSVGLAGGCAMSGYVGDNFGRRPAIICCYALVACFGILSACAWNFPMLLATRLLLGLSMGVGMPTSLAIVNEISPGKWRVPLMGMRGIAFSIGNVLAVIVLMADDPNFAIFDWRVCYLSAAIPTVVLGIASFVFMPESPVFLEAKGRHDDAKKVLTWIMHCNGVGQLDKDAEYSPDIAPQPTVPGISSASDEHNSWWAQICTVFNRHLALSTIIMIMSAFSLNFLDCGLAYAEPHVLQHTHASIAAGWQLFYKYLINMAMIFFVMFPAAALDRRIALISAFSCSIIGVVLFAWTGTIREPDALLTALYYGGRYLPQFTIALGFVVTFQVSVEIYPTWIVSTGSGFIVGGGSVGTIIAPFVFKFIQNCGWSWQLHYYVMAVFCGIAAILAIGLNNLDQLTMAARDGAMDHACP